MESTPKKLFVISSFFGGALFLLALPGIVIFLIVWALVYSESTVSRAGMTSSAMVVDKLRIRDFALAHDILPKSLAELPTTDGKGDSTKDGWGRPIIYSFDSNGFVTLKARGITNSFATKDSHGDWIHD